MALTSNCSTFLFYAKTLGVNFNKTLMLGRLNLYVTKENIQSDINRFQNNTKKIDEVVFSDEYSEPLFHILGAETVESIDYSNYEKATIVHDLNTPIPEKYKNSFTAIVDGGTIEHVFNFPVAIKNCMEALEVGGHYIGITPANNLMGHGFYQFAPELYYNVFSKENGFEIKQVIVAAQRADGSFSDWYEVIDPRIVKSRVQIRNANPVYLMVIAHKIAVTEIFSTPPNQSTYETIWTVREALNENKVPPKESKLKYIYRRFTPRFLKVFAHNVIDLFTKEKVVDEDFGEMNAKHFRKFSG